MIFASFIYEFIRGAVGNTADTVLIDMDFRSLYQINPDHLVVLGYASISGMRKDAGGANVNSAEMFSCRLIGNFNETFNVPASIVVPRVGDSIASFSGICFTNSTPFLAPPNSKILMPATFQVEFDPSGTIQAAANDSIRVLFTVGYDIVQKTTRF